jgi:hypothetical protein
VNHHFVAKLGRSKLRHYKKTNWTRKHGSKDPPLQGLRQQTSTKLSDVQEQGCGLLTWDTERHYKKIQDRQECLSYHGQ